MCNELQVQKSSGSDKEKLRVNPKSQSKVNPRSQTYQRFFDWLISLGPPKIPQGNIPLKYPLKINILWFTFIYDIEHLNSNSPLKSHLVIAWTVARILHS